MKALYRKYRPRTLAEVVGQEKVTDVLANSIKKSKISHAYIFTGPRGTGKTSVARIFAHEINNFPYELEDSYIDIIEIDGASNRGIDSIREIREKANIAPAKGKYKVYIIDEFHMLTKEAFNALLKTLEEPPAHVVFILATTDIEKAPITIISRAQLFTFSLATPEVMQQHLKTICTQENIHISDDALKVIVRRGGGSFRDSLSLLDQISSLASDDQEISQTLVESSLGLPKDTIIASLIDAYSTQDLTAISNQLKNALATGIKPTTLAEELIKTILSSPTTKLLPLLNQLPSVKDPFSEAKLLLALAPTESPSHQKTTSAPIPSQPSQSIPAAPQPVTHQVSEQPVAAPPSIITTPPTTFSWDTYITAVQKTSIGAAMWLKKCQFTLKNSTLNLYPPTPTARSILVSENNRKVLTDCLNADLGLKIHDTSEQVTPVKKDPKISMINDIMGETQEVNNGGDIPF